MNAENECRECHGTGKLDFVPEWFVESACVIVPKIKLSDGQYRDLTENEVQDLLYK